MEESRSEQDVPSSFRSTSESTYITKYKETVLSGYFCFYILTL